MGSVAVLGGGLAGLSVAARLHALGVDCDVYEAGETCGGMARTLSFDKFSVDTGAHRIHDVDPVITNFLHSTLPGELQVISGNSSVRIGERRVQFPLSGLNLLKTIPIPQLVQYARDWMSRPRDNSGTFAGQALNRFGYSLAKDFILDYSRKLWGVCPSRLSTELGTTRFKELTLRSAITELIVGRGKVDQHLEGEFLYPRGGFGQIAFALEGQIPDQNVMTETAVRGIDNFPGGFMVTSRAGARVYDRVISTLPLNATAQLASWVPIDDHDSFEYRDLVTVFLTLDRESVTDDASIYFPEKDFPVTRIHEPRNRCRTMSPAGATSILAEIPVDPRKIDEYTDGSKVTAMVVAGLVERGLFRFSDVQWSHIRHIPAAYPVITIDKMACRNRLIRRLESQDGFYCLGRNATFRYQHVHQIMSDSEAIVQQMASQSLENMSLSASRQVER